MRPIPLPTRRASASLLNTAASSTTATARTTSPIRAAEMNAALALPRDHEEHDREHRQRQLHEDVPDPADAHVEGDRRAGEPPRMQDRVRQSDRDRAAARQRVGDRCGRLGQRPPPARDAGPGNAAMFAHQYVKRLKIVAAMSVPISRA